MKLLCCLDASPSLAEMHIITNGTAATDEQLRALQSLGRLASVKVSLESADPHTNDRIRGRGNLDRVCDGIERLRRNTGKDVVLMMTLSKDNLHDIDGMVRFCRTRDVRGLILERFVPLGRGAGQKDRMLSPADWQSVVSDVLRLSDSDQLPSEMTDWRAFRLSFENGEVALEGALCNLGDESMALMPDGTVYPCRRLPVPVGNAAREPFDAILRRLASRCAQTHAGPDDPCLGCRALSAAIGRGYP